MAGGEQRTAQAAWPPALVHVGMSDDSCQSCSWYSSLCQGHGAPATCVNVLSPPGRHRPHLRGAAAAGRGLRLLAAPEAQGAATQGHSKDTRILEWSPPQAGASCECRGSRGQPASAQLVLSHHQGCPGPGPSEPSSLKSSASSPVSDHSGTRQASAGLSEAKRIGGRRPGEGPASARSGGHAECLSPGGLRSTRSFLTAPGATSPRSRGPQGSFHFQDSPLGWRVAASLVSSPVAFPLCEGV